MIVNSTPRFGGKSTSVAEYMTHPGNEDVICITPTHAQGDIVHGIARQFDPKISRQRFKTLASFRDTCPPDTRVVLDEADGVISQAIGANVELIALTERI